MVQLAFLVLPFLFPFPGRTMAQPFPLRPGDVISLSVLARPEMSRDHVVGLDGMISVHVVGRVRAADETAASLEAKIESRLTEIFGQPGSATVDIVTYRPVIVGGAVAAPGSMAYRADLDVATAIALAGGAGGGLAGDDLTGRMRMAAEAARYATLRVRLGDRLMRQARLQAERDGTRLETAPGDIRTLAGAQTDALLNGQAQLQDRRAEALAQRETQADARRELAQGEAAAYAERQGLIRRQLDATLEELARQQQLSERGLALSERQLTLRVSADRYRADELEAVALEAEARQRVSDAANEVEATRTARQGDIARELAALTSEILEIRTEMQQAQRFLAEFGGPAAIATSQIAPRYLIRRRDAEGVKEFPATDDMLLQPGDHLRVMLPDDLQEKAGDGS